MTAPATSIESKSDEHLNELFEVLYNPEASAQQVLTMLRKNRNQVVRQYRKLLGEAVKYLDDAETIEIRRNPNGHIFVQQLGKEEYDTGIEQDELDAIELGTLISGIAGLEFTRNSPSLEFILPFHGARFTIMGTPITSPMWAIRKRINRPIVIEEYFRNKQITKNQLDLLDYYIDNDKPILIAAPQRAGKTTFGNAVLTRVYQKFPSTLFGIIEDTPELNVPTTNKYEWLTCDRIGFTYGMLMKKTLRFGAPSLSIGELRQDASALLKGWTNSKQRTGISTAHASSELGAMYLLEQLITEENKPVDRRFFYEAIGGIVVLKPIPGGKPRVEKVTHIEAISATGEYRFYKGGEYRP